MKILRTILLTSFFASSLALAAEPDLIKKEVADLYAKGKYLAAVESADEYMKYESIRGQLNYIKGLSYNRLEKFDKAEAAFKAAIKEGFKSPDLFYEAGQANFAMRDYDQAKKYFKLSREGGYKPDTCHFYLASIEDTLENRAEAGKLYNEIAHDEKAAGTLRKASYEKLINWELEAIEEDEKSSIEQKRELVESKVMPMFDEALEHDFNQPLEELKDKTKKKYGMGKHKKRWWSVGLSQDVKYDSNVVTESDDATIKKSNKDSIYYKTELEGSAKVTLPWEVDTKFRARGNTTWYEEKDLTYIKSNDSDAIVPSVKFEKNLKEALGGFELIPSLYGEYSYNRKNYQMKSNNSFYSESYTTGVGIAGNWFGIGNSSLEGRYKILESYTTANDSDTISVIANQTAKLPWSHMLIFLYTGTFTSMDRTPISDTDSHLFRLDYLMPDLLTLYWDLGASYTSTDNVGKPTTRGVETKYDYSFKLGKKFLDYFDVAGKFEYTTQDSKDFRNYKYDKYVYGIEASIKY